MKSFKYFLMIMVTVIMTSFMSVSAKDNFKKFNSINKNQTKFVTKAQEYCGDGFTAKLSLIVLIDSESSSVDANIHVCVISAKRNAKYRDFIKITEDAPLYVGRSGNTPTEFDIISNDYRRWHTEGERYAAEASYDIDDIDELWDANKIRIDTYNGYLDLEGSELKSVIRTLKTEFEKKTLKKAEETFYRKTDPTHNF